MPLGRAIAKILLPKLVPELMSFSSIENALKRSGVSYARNLMVSDIRTAMQNWSKGVFYEDAPFKAKIPKKAIIDADLRRDADYMVKVRVRKTDRASGQSTEDYVTFYTDTEGTPEEYWKQFREQFGDHYEDEGKEVSYVAVDRLFRNRKTLGL
jgi:hypothetical protein